MTGLLRVHGGGCRVVCKAEPIPVASPPFIEETLVGTIPATFSL